MTVYLILPSAVVLDLVELSVIKGFKVVRGQPQLSLYCITISSVLFKLPGVGIADRGGVCQWTCYMCRASSLLLKM